MRNNWTRRAHMVAGMIPRENKPAPWWYVPLIAILIFAALGFAGTRDYNDAVLHEAHHCRMLEINEQTGGEYGWPDYEPEIDCGL